MITIDQQLADLFTTYATLDATRAAAAQTGPTHTATLTQTDAYCARLLTTLGHTTTR